MLSVEELDILEDDVMEYLSDNITGLLSNLNRKELLDDFLDLIGMRRQGSVAYVSDQYKTGKIVVIGGSEVKEDVLRSIGKKLGIDKKRFEFCLDYEDIQKYDFRKMQYNRRNRR